MLRSQLSQGTATAHELADILCSTSSMEKSMKAKMGREKELDRQIRTWKIAEKLYE